MYKEKKSKLISLSLTKGGWKLKQTFLADLGPPSSKGKTLFCSCSCDLSKFYPSAVSGFLK